MVNPSSRDDSDCKASDWLIELVSNDCVSVVIAVENHSIHALVPGIAVSCVLNSVLSNPLVCVTSALSMDLNDSHHSAKSILVPLIGIQMLCGPSLSRSSEIVQSAVLDSVINVVHCWGWTLSSSISSGDFPPLLNSYLGSFLAFLEVTCESVGFSVAFQLLTCFPIHEFFSWGLTLSQLHNIRELASLLMISRFYRKNLFWDFWISGCAD